MSLNIPMPLLLAGERSPLPFDARQNRPKAPPYSSCCSIGRGRSFEQLQPRDAGDYGVRIEDRVDERVRHTAKPFSRRETVAVLGPRAVGDLPLRRAGRALTGGPQHRPRVVDQAAGHASSLWLLRTDGSGSPTTQGVNRASSLITTGERPLARMRRVGWNRLGEGRSLG